MATLSYACTSKHHVLKSFFCNCWAYRVSLHGIRFIKLYVHFQLSYLCKYLRNKKRLYYMAENSLDFFDYKQRAQTSAVNI